MPEEGGAASAAAAAIALGRRRSQLAHPLEHGGRQREAEARLPAAEAARERAQLGVKRVDRVGAVPIGSPKSTRPPSLSGSISDGLAALDDDGRSVSSSTSVWTAYG